MAHLLVLEFETDEASEMYTRVDRILGIDSSTGKGDWPPGLETHVAAVDGASFVVVEKWETKEAQEKFMADRLGPALHEGGAPQPKRVQWFDVIGEKK